MKHVKSKENRLTIETLSHLLRVSTSRVEVDFPELSSTHPHSTYLSHQTSYKNYN